MMKKILDRLCWIFITIGLILAIVLTGVCDWFNLTFGVSLEEILFTVTSPLEGSDISFFEDAIQYLKPTFFYAFVVLLVLILSWIVFKKIKINISLVIKRKKFLFDFYKVYRGICFVLTVVCLVQVIRYGDSSLQISTYISRKLQKTTIYEEQYVHPDSVSISNDGEKKNIIYIYLESMETTYASREAGGEQDTINYIPNLTALADKYISFSHNDKLGGSSLTTGSGWTMGALFSTTSGIPFSFPVEGNSMNGYQEFAPGVTALGDVLEKEGYNQVFLCGSDGNFAGRAKYFEQHGNYKVLDYFYAKDMGYIPEDHYVWWGYEDAYLYEIAKTELLKIASEEEPFNFTMLTVDTHHVDGYVCDQCRNEYPDQLGNVLACADRQINEFVTWCQQQDFYEDTVIVILGDHFRMDNSLVNDVNDRRVYNCIINSDTKVKNDLHNREFTSLDWFPTVLAAMGYEIEGNRLGMGTNLFSEKATLTEELGFEEFNTELSKYSQYYIDNFE